MSPPTPRHHPAVIVLHWLTAALVALGVVAVLGHEWSDSDAWRHRLLDAHRLLGLAVLAVAALRLPLSRGLGAGRVNAGLPKPFAGAAALSHAALYLLLVATPLLGWAQWSASGKTMRLFAGLPVPALLAPDRGLAEWLGSSHQAAAWSLLAVVAAHALAALWHHHWRGDDVLRSMSPLPPVPARRGRALQVG